MIVEPSDRERAMWPDATREYVEGIELRTKALLKQRFETETLNNIKDCPWCDMFPLIVEVPSGKSILSCTNKDCEVQPHTSQPTQHEAILAWNRRNRSLELTADYCDYYEKELIPQLKAKIIKLLCLAEVSDEKEERIMTEEITIAETINGFIVTVPNSFGGRDISTFEQREDDDCMIEALVSALYCVIECLGCQGSKHDTCRIKVSCKNEENEAN